MRESDPVCGGGAQPNTADITPFDTEMDMANNSPGLSPASTGKGQFFYSTAMQSLLPYLGSGRRKHPQASESWQSELVSKIFAPDNHTDYEHEESTGGTKIHTYHGKHVTNAEASSIRDNGYVLPCLRVEPSVVDDVLPRGLQEIIPVLATRSRGASPSEHTGKKSEQRKQYTSKIFSKIKKVAIGKYCREDILKTIDPLTILYNDCSLAAISKWATKGGTPAHGDAYSPTCTKHIQRCPVARTILRRCSVCREFGHFETECSNADDNAILRLAESIKGEDIVEGGEKDAQISPRVLTPVQLNNDTVNYDSDVSSVVDIEGIGDFVVEQRKRTNAEPEASREEQKKGLSFTNGGWAVPVALVPHNINADTSLLKDFSVEGDDGQRPDGIWDVKELEKGDICWSKCSGAPKGFLGRDDWWPSAVTSLDGASGRTFAVKMFSLDDHVLPTDVVPFFRHFEAFVSHRQPNMEGADTFRKAMDEAREAAGFKSRAELIRRCREINKEGAQSETRGTKRLRPEEWNEAKVNVIDGIEIFGMADEEARMGSQSSGRKRKKINESTADVDNTQPVVAVNKLIGGVLAWIETDTYSWDNGISAERPKLRTGFGCSFDVSSGKVLVSTVDVSCIEKIANLAVRSYEKEKTKEITLSSVHLGQSLWVPVESLVLVADPSSLTEKHLCEQELVSLLRQARTDPLYRQEPRKEASEELKPLHSTLNGHDENLEVAIKVDTLCEGTVADNEREEALLSRDDRHMNVLESGAKADIVSFSEKKQRPGEPAPAPAPAPLTAPEPKHDRLGRAGEPPGVNPPPGRTRPRLSSKNSDSARVSSAESCATDDVRRTETQGDSGVDSFAEGDAAPTPAKKPGDIALDASALVSDDAAPDDDKLTEDDDEVIHLGDGVYYADRLLDVRKSSRSVKYLVKWKGTNEHTWEPAENILNQNLVNIFYANRTLNSLKRTKEANDRKSLTYKMIVVLARGVIILQNSIEIPTEQDGEGETICPFCKKEFQNPKLYRAHSKREHSKEPNFKIINEASKVLEATWFG